MFSPTFKYTLHYFDRSVIKTNWRAINESPLKKVGNRIRSIARQSIRRRPNPNLHSAAGTPPYAHAGLTTSKGKRGVSPPFKQIYSIPNWAATNVVIGMTYYGGRPPVPGLHELGGTARRRVFVNMGRRQLKKGGLGAIIYKPVTKNVTYPPRPFMRPALAKVLPTLPYFWRNSLTLSRAA